MIVGTVEPLCAVRNAGCFPLVFPLRGDLRAMKTASSASVLYRAFSMRDGVLFRDVQALNDNDYETGASHVQSVLQMLDKDLSEQAAEVKAKTMAVLSTCPVRSGSLSVLPFGVPVAVMRGLPSSLS